MQNPIVSILIPVYRTEDFLEECVESVLNQTYTNLGIWRENPRPFNDWVVDTSCVFVDGSGNCCTSYASGGQQN